MQTNFQKKPNSMKVTVFADDDEEQLNNLEIEGTDNE